MLTDLALSALTNVIVAVSQAFVAGKLFRPDLERGSAAWWWAWSMTVIAATFSLGAIDHGFFEAINHPLHQQLVVVNRMLVAVAAFLIVVTASAQFLGRRGHRIACLLSGVINLIAAVWVVFSDNFFIVIGSYSIAFLFFLVLNGAGLIRGRGSWALLAGIVIVFAASALPLMGYEGFAGLGMYGTYHVVLLPGVIAFYFGGLALDRTVRKRL